MPIFGSNTKSNSVGNSAVEVFNPNAAPFSTLTGPLKDPIIENTGSVTVYLGQSGVTSSTGLPLLAGQQITYNGFSTPTGASGTGLYAITASGTSTVVVGLATININE